MIITQQKKNLRKAMFAERNNLSVQLKIVYDKWICEELERILTEREANIIHVYIPMGSEIDIRPLISHLLEKEKTVVCPKTLPHHRLENRILHSLADLETGIMGTQHPRKVEVYSGKYDCIIVPGLAIDQRMYRLGYGGGYYDTFLAEQPDAYTIGIYYPFQQIEEVPTEQHDVKLDAILVKPFG